MKLLVLDEGHKSVKAKTPKRELSYETAVAQLSAAQYAEIEMAAGPEGPGLDYAVINGTPYAFGEQAESFEDVLRPKLEARYTQGYYGVIAAYTMARIFQQGGEVGIFGSHPPKAVRYREDLIRSVLGHWRVEMWERTADFDVVYCQTFDEPKGGLMNIVLTADGLAYAHPEIDGGSALMIDIGGRTTDFLKVKARGQVDYSIRASVEMGILDILEWFLEAFEHEHQDILKGTHPTWEQIRAAFKDGQNLHGGGRTYKCERLIQQATNRLLNRIEKAYTSIAGGPFPYDTIGLTGGGSADLYDRLLPLLNHDHVILADEPGSIYMANVRGGLKLYRMLEATEALS